jgi:signal transduction histidine kinase
MDRRLESERARIARELHDHLGQVLTALNMNLAWLDKRTADIDPAVNARVSESIGYVTQMTAMIRSLCKSLHPVVLDHHGLVEAIRSQITEFEQYSQINCELSVRPADLEVSKPVAIAAYRIVQEALTNVARHSRASRSYVSMRLNGEALTITVRDDGAGAAPVRLAGSHSLGILGMRERASAAGGSFHIENAPGGGIRLRAELPLKPPTPRDRRRPPDRNRHAKPVRLK